MIKWLWTLMICLLSISAYSQPSSSDHQVATITAVTPHQKDTGEGARDLNQYDVSLKVGDSGYVVLYTPPSGANGVEYAVGMDLLVVIGKDSITFTKFGRTSEAPILSRQELSSENVVNWSRVPSEYYNMKLKHLTDRLSLSSEQQSQMKPILEQEAGDAGQFISNSVLSMEDRLTKLDKVVRASDQKMKPILSSTQWQTLQNIRKTQKQEMKQLIAEKPKD
jgi:hypothetical protein